MIREAERTKQQGVRIIVILVYEDESEDEYGLEYGLEYYLEDEDFLDENKSDSLDEHESDRIKNEEFGFLNQVASTPEDYYFVGESIQLVSTFATIANRLVAESSSGGSGLTRL